VREQFLVELDTRGGAADLDELNRLFGAWVEGVYHHRTHSETGQAPMDRFLAGAPPRLPTPAELREAFLWAECRQVTKQAMVSLFGNSYQVDPALVGATVELVFDPFDLAHIEVRYHKRPMGAAVPFQLGRHVHPAAKPDPAVQATPHPSGIDYLAMVEQRIAATQRRRIAYALLPELPAPNAGTDPGAGTNDHAATPDPNPHDATKIGPLGVQLHLAATITPDPAAQPAVGGPTTKPITDIEHADQPTNIDTVQTEDAS
jgi:putative transposase